MSTPPSFSIWIPRITGILSILGSSAIIFIIMSDRKRKLSRSKNRLMLLMSIFDVIQSVSLAFSVMPLPRHQGVYGARGTFNSFRVQVFFILLGMTVPLYNASLSLLYLLTIRYNIPIKVFSSKIEPFLHTISIVVPLSMSILLVTRYWESISSSPPPVTIYSLFSIFPAAMLYIVIVAVSFTLTLLSMMSISYAVIDQQNNMTRHNFSTHQTNRSTILRTKETVIQAIFYSLACFLTHISSFIMAIIGLHGSGIKYVFSFWQVASIILFPLQGFWNFVLYCRPGVKHVRKMNPEISLFGAIREVVFNAESVADSFHRRRGRRLVQTVVRGVKRTALSRNEVDSNRPQCIRESTAVSFGKDPEENQSKLQQFRGKHIHFQPVESDKNENESPSNAATSPSTRRTSVASIASFLLDHSFDESLESNQSDHHGMESDMVEMEGK